MSKGKGESVELEINIEKVDDDICIPFGDSVDCFQMRSDGIFLNGELHIWEEILMVHITNRGLLDKLKEQKNDKTK